ncbi:MAG: three-Cys-motif partner protein TcmP [Patescibacteria group bacterium]|jgi:three-Cys-motif partner protein
MSKIAPTIWKLEPHTEAKHKILQKYLNAWLPIITRWNGRVLFIDGFAGPGEYIGGKPGSPMIAFEAIIKHKFPISSEMILFFIEKDAKRCEHLEKMVASLDKPKNINITVKHGEFDKTLSEVLNLLEEQKKKIAPALVFIDPFGFTGIPLDLIKRIMENQKCEVMITFMYEEINRFIGLEKLWPSLEETFGTDTWKAVISEKDSKQRSEMLHNIYRDQLKNEAGVKFVRSFKMKNKMNKDDYFLFFGTNNILGLKKIKEAMWKIDETGAFEFSDATYNPSQAILFSNKPNFYLLKKILINNFKNKLVKISDLEYFIITKTPFRETHYKSNILAKMEKATEPELRRRCDVCLKNGTCKPRLGTFPNECCVIEFL